jgi:hypothetical protein
MHRVSPIAFVLVYFLCVVMCLAIATMLGWHLWGVAVGETAVESHDHEHYRKIAASRGVVRLNCHLFSSPSNISRRHSKTHMTLGLFFVRSKGLPQTLIFQKAKESPTLL